MPPKRQFSDSDPSDEDETTSEEESSDSSDPTDKETKINTVKDKSNDSVVAEGTVIMNKPHDIVYTVEGESERIATPMALDRRIGTPESLTRSDNLTLRNNPNDEYYAADGDEVDTPTKEHPMGVASGTISNVVPGDGGNVRNISHDGKMIRNASHDEFSDVEHDMQEVVNTPRAIGNAPTDGVALNDNPYDLAFDADGESVASANEASPQGISTGGHTGVGMTRQPEDDESDSATDSDDDDGGKTPKMGAIAVAAAQLGKGAPDYNPADYLYLNSKLPRDVVELFELIGNYQPVEMELPAKFRPFIPDYIPCVGDIDTFCKIPRPDGYPDNFGLVVADEPSSKQSNPAVVKISLTHSSKLAPKATFVHSLQNAHQKPDEIDRWVRDIQNIDKKPLTTVNYSRSMPTIDELLQVWPQEFEDLLTSDIQFPPHTIDLDIEQYVRLLCAVLDIPVYENIIESLHVMFTLYLEFRQNQHFQHI